MKKILITGGTGYLGRSLAKFYKKKYKVFLGARNNKQNFSANKETGCDIIPLDVSNINSVNDALNFTKPNIVIHAAATKFVDLSEKYPFECIDTNILGSANVARACINKKVSTVIGVSTDKASPPIKNIYGLSKSAMERMFCSMNNYGSTKFICVRYGNVAWSTGSVLPIWKEMLAKKKKIISTGPYMRRFFFTVDDAVGLINAALNHSKILNGKVLSVEMKSTQMIEILKVWKKEFGAKYELSKNRKGDRVDEYLIGKEELQYAKKIYFNKKLHYILDFNKNSKITIKEPVSSENAKKLTFKEIKNIISFGLEEKSV